MKTCMKRITALVLALLMVLALCSCTNDKSDVEKTLKHFETSCREADMEGMLECLEPEVADMMENTITFFGALARVDAMELINSAIPLLFNFAWPEGSFLDTLKFKANDITISDDTAQVHCTMSFDFEGKHYEQAVVIHMVRIDDKDLPWRIAAVDEG